MESLPTAAFLGSRMPAWKKGRPVCDRTPSDDTCVLEAYFLIKENIPFLQNRR